MAREEKKLLRGPRILGGVCSGIAAYFNVDALIVRIIALIVACCSVGLAIVPYVALWVILPSQKSEQDFVRPVEVDPVSIQSDIYGKVVDSKQAEHPQVPFGVNAGAGHIPPQPPLQAAARPASVQVNEPSWYAQVPAGNATSYAHIPASGTTPYTQAPTNNTAPCTHTATNSAVQHPVAEAPLKPASQQKESPMYLVVGVLVLLLVVMFVLFARFFSGLLPGSSYTQFFPILFSAVGVAILVIPSKKRSLAVRLCAFLLCTECAFLLLPFSLGLVPFSVLGSLSTATVVLWVIFACLFIVALVLQKEPLLLCLVAIFLLAIVFTFSDTGVFNRIMDLFSLQVPHKVPYPKAISLYSYSPGIS